MGALSIGATYLPPFRLSLAQGRNCMLGDHSGKQGGFSELSSELQLVVDRDAVRGDLRDHGLHRASDLVDRTGPEFGQPIAGLLVQREGGQVLVRRHEPHPVDPEVAQRHGGSVQEPPADAVPLRLRQHCEAGDLGAVLGLQVPAQKPDPVIPVGGDEAAAPERIDERAAARLKAPTELSIEQRFGPGEIRAGIECADVELAGIERPGAGRQGVGNCQNPRP